MQAFTWTKTNRGADMLCYDGYMYMLSKQQKSGEHYYRCALAKVEPIKCKSTLNMSPGKDFISRLPSVLHNHSKPSAHMPAVKRLRHNVKTRVVAEKRSKPQAIFMEEVGRSIREESLNVKEIANIIPTYKSMSHSLWNMKHANMPKNPVTTDDIELTNDKYVLTNDFKRYKLFDTLDDQRMICYASDIGLDILSKSKEWHADGTFRCAPSKYAQLYLIHGWYKGHMYLCAKIFDQYTNKLHYVTLQPYSSSFKCIWAF